MFFHHSLGYGHDAWPGIVMAVGMGIFWIAVIVLVVWLVRQYAGRRAAESAATPVGPPVAGTTYLQAPAGVETPIQILERRYAAGEIDRDEFLRRKDDLTQPPPTA
jgi:putative membrane protein